MIIQFAIFNILNVIIQTAKSIVTIKCNKYIAAVVNAIAYGLYTYIIVLTNAEINLWFKIIVVALANLVGVFVVKWVEEKKRKDQLWKVEATVCEPYTESLHKSLNEQDIPHNYIENIGKYSVFNIYCATQKDSAKVKGLLEYHKAKFFVSESKIL